MRKLYCNAVTPYTDPVSHEAIWLALIIPQVLLVMYCCSLSGKLKFMGGN